MDFNEKVKVVNEYVLKFNQMLMAFSIGIIAFSIQTIEKNSQYSYMIFLYITWVALGICFFVGLIRMHHQQKVLTRNASEAFNTEILNKEFKINLKKMRDTNHKSAQLYRIMLFSFCVGLILFGIFKIINL